MKKAKTVATLPIARLGSGVNRASPECFCTPETFVIQRI